MNTKVTKLVLFAFIGLFIVFGLLNSFYILETGEQAVIQRFGAKIAVITKTGVNFKAPFIDTVTTVNTQQTHSIQYGYKIASGSTTTQAATYIDVEDEQVVLTKGSYLVNVGAIIQYRITDAADYVLNVDDQEDTIRLAFESVLRRNMQNQALESALIEKESIAIEVLPELAKKVNSYGLGLTITEVKFTDVLLPEEVRFAYDDVNIAENEKTEYLSKAEKYKNEMVPKARATAYQRIQSAEAYKAEKVSQAKGDVENFLQVYEKYAVSKDVTRTRLYIETMETVLKKVKNKFIIDFDSNEGVVKYLPLDPKRLSE